MSSTPLPLVEELERRSSPGPLPHALAFDGQSLWIGTRDTQRLIRVDIVGWHANDIAQCPGTPWGMTAHDDVLRVTCGEGPDDTRRIRTFSPATGWDTPYIACPGDEGSYMAHDGRDLYLVQWHRHRVLRLDRIGMPISEIQLPHGCTGAAFVGTHLFLVTTDDEEGAETSEHWLSRVDISTGECVDLRRFGYAARSLAFDGTTLWANHRKVNTLVRLRVPAIATSH